MFSKEGLRVSIHIHIHIDMYMIYTDIYVNMHECMQKYQTPNPKPWILGTVMAV